MKKIGDVLKTQYGCWIAAVDAKDACKLKAAYAAYTKNAGIDISPSKETAMGGKGFGSDYGCKNRTPKGTVYQR